MTSGRENERGFILSIGQIRWMKEASPTFYVLRERITFFCHMAVGEPPLGLGLELGGGVKGDRPGQTLQGQARRLVSVCEGTKEERGRSEGQI